MKLINIDRMHLAIFADRLREYLEKAIQYSDGRFSIEDILSFIDKNEMFLWVFYNDNTKDIEGCMVTEIVQYPKKRVFMINFLSADSFDSVSCLIDDLSIICKENKCDCIEFHGRHGWEKKLKSLDFEKLYVVMRKEL